MKNWIRTIMTMFIAIVCVVLFGSISSCTHKSGRCVLSAQDSVMIAEAVVNYSNPSILTVDDALSYQQECKSRYSVDSVFRTLPQDVIQHVVTVLINRNTTVTVKGIVAEYEMSKNIYNNLSPKTTIMPELEVIKTDSTIEYKTKEE